MTDAPAAAGTPMSGEQVARMLEQAADMVEAEITDLKAQLSACRTELAAAQEERENWRAVAYKNGAAEIEEAKNVIRLNEQIAWLLGHISEEEHMRFVERFQ